MFITNVKCVVGFVILLLILKMTKSSMKASKKKPSISLKKHDNGYFCSSVGNFTSDPLVFVTTNNKYINKKTTSSYQTLEKLDGNFNCDFVNNPTCWINQNWTLSQSGDHEINPVVDERWEEFAVESVGLNDTDKFIKVNDENYFIALSINAYKQPQIVLCENITKSTQCVWLTINEIDSNDIGIILRKCRALSFNPFSNKDSGCKRLSKMHINDDTKPSWRHFIIYKQADYMVFEETNRKDKMIGYRERISLKEGNQEFILKNIYFKNTQWKEHKFEYLTFNTSNTNIQLGPTHKSNISHSLCISLYTAMCITCELTIKIGSKNVTHIVNEKEIIRPTWKNRKFSVSIEADKEYRIYMYGNNKNAHYKSFWAVDNIRYCHDNDTRDVKLSTEEEVPDIFCQDLNYPNWKATLEGIESTGTENISYSFDEKLHLTWMYPSAIGEFNITLKQTGTDMEGPNHFTIINKNYKTPKQENHSYTFEENIPYSSTYMLTICIKEYCFINKEINTPPVEPKLQDQIKMGNEIINNSINLTIPGINLETKSRYSFMYVVVCEKPNDSDNFTRKEKLYLSILQTVICDGVSWIAAELQTTNDTILFLVGDNSTKYYNNFVEPLRNKPMDPTKSYECNVVLMNIYKDEPVFSSQNAKMPKRKDITCYWVLIAIGCIIVGFIIFICVREIKQKYKKRNQNRADSPTDGNTVSFEVMPLNTVSTENDTEL